MLRVHTCMLVHMCVQFPAEARRGYAILAAGIEGGCEPLMWVLGIEVRTSARAELVLNP